jgi:hypothetical protein
MTNGSNNSLCAQGWVGQAQPPFSQWRFSLSEKRNSAAEKSEAESGQKFLFPDPFPFCPHNWKFQKSESGFSSKKVRILTKRHRPCSAETRRE